jgi:polyisoprenoid-binding protein YceI
MITNTHAAISSALTDSLGAAFTTPCRASSSGDPAGAPAKRREIEAGADTTLMLRAFEHPACRGRIVAMLRSHMALQTWTIDRSHSMLGFHVRHLMIANVHGRFDRWDGTLEFDPEDPEASRVEITIDASSIDTREPQRDEHLRSPEFLNVEKVPQITFRSTSVDRVTLDEYEVVGELTIGGVTRTLILDATRTAVITDQQNHPRVGFLIGGHISRKDFGLTWNRVLETGGVVVGDRVTMAIEVEAFQLPESRQVPEPTRATGGQY